MGQAKILVSACLLGRPVRYDGKAKTLSSNLLETWQAEGRVISLCPEVAAGFPTPRPPAEIEAGANAQDVLSGSRRIMETTGRNVSSTFVKGAHIALELARENDCRFALLTDGSPSCGSTFIYDGSFSGQRRTGHGVVAELLMQNGIRVYPQTQITQLALDLAKIAHSPPTH